MTTEAVTQLEIDQRNNNSTPRYQEAAAKLAWDRTVAFFKANLA